MEPFEAKLDEATSLTTGHLLGAVAMVIDRQGNFLYRHAAGRQFLDGSSPLHPDCTMSLTSAAKFLTNVAALQLVERGLLTLDEPINQHLPEIDKCMIVEEAKSHSPHGTAAEVDKATLVFRRPRRDVTLRDLLLNTSGMGTSDTYADRLGRDVPPPEFPADAHYLARLRSTHLFFEPGEGFNYGWSVYYVQLLVERLGGRDTYVDYAAEHIFGALGMTASTYMPAGMDHVWRRRLQMVERDPEAAERGTPRLLARDDATAGVTCSMSDVARLFADLMSPDCKLLRRQEHRDMLFRPQLAPGGPAHQGLLGDVTNYGFLLPLEDDVSEKVSWALPLPPPVNWTVAGTLLEEDDALPGTGVPGGTVTFEGMPNLMWTMNRERGRMMFFGTQLLPDYDVKAHNLAVRFMRDAWQTFG